MTTFYNNRDGLYTAHLKKIEPQFSKNEKEHLHSSNGSNNTSNTTSTSVIEATPTTSSNGGKKTRRKAVKLDDDT